MTAGDDDEAVARAGAGDGTGDDAGDDEAVDEADPLLRALAAAPAIPLAVVDRRPPFELGHFRVLARIGAGGMGVVYRALDTRLDRDVALKLLPITRGALVEHRRRLLREARAAAAVAHPSIAAVHEVGEIDGEVYVAMELVPGRTLREALASDGAFAPARAYAIGAQIAAALAAAHRAGIVHRDLKPDNVLVDDSERVRVVDFGLARREPDAGAGPATVTVEHGVVGTPAYMSPEQARGEIVGRSSDVFSFGVVLYELLAGAPPFRGRTTTDVLAAILRDAPPPLEARVPAPLAAVVMRCLEKDPDARFADGAVLVEALAEAHVDAPIAHRPPPASARPRAPRRPRRGRTARTLIAAAALALAGGAAVALAIAGHQRGAAGATVDDRVIACPILAVDGVEAPNGWLGAAAATVACRRAAAYAGGRSDRVLMPAELLDLPHVPGEAFPRDPFDGVEARARSLAAARARADVYLDGSVAPDGDGFRVRLAAHARDGRALATAEATGVSLYLPMRAAVSELVFRGALPRRLFTDGEHASVTGLRDVGSENAALDAWEAQEVDLPDRGFTWWPSPPEPDRSSPAAFARTAPWGQRVPLAETRALAEEAGRLADGASGQVRDTLRADEARLWLRTGDNVRAAVAARAAVADDPRRPDAWGVLNSALSTDSGHGVFARAYSAWLPDEPDAWAIRARSDANGDDEALRYSARMDLLAPRSALYAMLHALMLVRADRREEARAIAARLATLGDDAKPAVEAIAAEADASEGRFGRAFERAHVALATMSEFGEPDNGEIQLLATLLDLAQLFGRERAIADEIVERFVPAGAAPHIRARHPAVLGLSAACALASPPLAARCFATLRELIASGYFRWALVGPTLAVLDGRERYAQGDLAGAAAAWRPVVHDGARALTLVAADTFDAIGEPDLAERIDLEAGQGRRWNGVLRSDPRRARRAARRGDVETARALARAVIEAWTPADVPVPAVAEMRALLAELDRRHGRATHRRRL